MAIRIYDFYGICNKCEKERHYNSETGFCKKCDAINDKERFKVFGKKSLKTKHKPFSDLLKH